eukprot:14447720-Alexandrium_andersonii.AAC.1
MPKRRLRQWRPAEGRQLREERQLQPSGHRESAGGSALRGSAGPGPASARHAPSRAQRERRELGGVLLHD